LIHAAELASELHTLFVLPQNLAELTPIRQASFVESARALGESLPKGLNVLVGSAPDLIDDFVTNHQIDLVVATRAFDTTGMQEQAEVAERLFARGVALKLVGSYFAVEPGTVRKDDGSPLKVYTPFYRRWSALPIQGPMQLDVERVNWAQGEQAELPTYPPTPFLVRAGEQFALRTLERFKKRALGQYHEGRNRTDLPGTSHLSHALAHGEIHPRTILSQLGTGEGAEVFRKEIAWREFYADVLFHNPHTLNDYFDPKFTAMRYDDPKQNQDRLLAWQQGKTGYPIVDAAMRQLVETGWMHNRARMIVASFLVKDLHFEWQVGADFFEQHLSDFDPASNSHGWQWTAGCGTDASPYFRIFNPVLQGMKFDPNGDYVRKFVPELRHISGSAVHEPWKLIDGYANGYPAPIVDHSAERDESLARLKELKD
jgi:deoxyribodipyrimidine photo-lyase